MDINWKDIESIIEHYYQPLYRYCYRMMRNKEDAEDLVQEVFMNINRVLEEKKNIELHNNYLYKVAFNKCANRIKRDRLIKFISIDTTEGKKIYYEKDTYFENEISEELSEIISFLKAEERSLLIFKAIDEMSYEEISKIMGKPAVLLRKRYERIRKKIISKLEEREGLCNEEISFI